MLDRYRGDHRDVAMTWVGMHLVLNLARVVISSEVYEVLVSDYHILSALRLLLGRVDLLNVPVFSNGMLVLAQYNVLGVLSLWLALRFGISLGFSVIHRSLSGLNHADLGILALNSIFILKVLDHSVFINERALELLVLLVAVGPSLSLLFILHVFSKGSLPLSVQNDVV